MPADGLDDLVAVKPVAQIIEDIPALLPDA
jgi:hypothetical protein